MTARRVAVTGIGVVTPAGCDLDAFWNGLVCGRSAVERVDAIAAIGGPAVGARVKGFEPDRHIDAKSRRLMTDAVAFGVAAADLAWRDAGIEADAPEPLRRGAFVGSRGHSTERDDLLPAVRAASPNGVLSLAAFGAEGLPLVHPMWLLKGLSNNVLHFVTLRTRAQGMNNNLAMGGVAATLAIGEAFRTLQRGAIDVAIAGGYDSTLDAGRVELFRHSGLVSRADDPVGASRPFDRRRDGFVLAEGAGFVVMEPLEAAAARGAHVYAEVLGYGSATGPMRADLGPSADGFARALSGALADAGIDRPDAVFAHGLATLASDVEETRALKHVFGAAAPAIPAPALKSMIGNTCAASGAVEAAAAILALRHARLPPTINLDEPGDGCDLDYVSGREGRAMPLQVVATNNANLAGAHAALVFGRV